MNLDFEDDEESIFETFSDTIFCVCVVLLALVAMLALNINEQLAYFKIEPKFYGGAQRPHLYLNVYPYQNNELDVSTTQLHKLFSEDRTLYKVGLFSPTAALATTKRDHRKMIQPQQGESHDSISSLTLSSFYDLASGIEPGYLNLYEEKSPFLLPLNIKKDLLYPPNTLLEPAEDSKFKHLLKQVWPVYENPVYPVRSFRDYKDARVTVYVETFEKEGAPYLLIGHYALPADDIESGFLDFLIGLSSSHTEIVYLGKYWEDPQNQNNKRIAFFQDNGLIETAEEFKQHEYGWRENIKGFDLKFKNRPEWQKVNAETPPQELKAKVVSLINEMRLGQYLKNESQSEEAKSLLPPIVRYKDFWQLYVDACLEKPEFPPEWFLKLFLEKLGFNHFSLKVPDEVNKKSL